MADEQVLLCLGGPRGLLLGCLGGGGHQLGCDRSGSRRLLLAGSRGQTRVSGRSRSARRLWGLGSCRGEGAPGPLLLVLPDPPGLRAVELLLGGLQVTAGAVPLAAGGLGRDGLGGEGQRERAERN